MPKLYRHRALIETNGHFPIDMLRYDRCFPAHEADSKKIARLINEDILINQTDRQVWVERLAEKTWTWTEGRWKSFGTQIVKMEIEAI